MPSIYLSPSTQEYNTTVLGNSEEYYMNLIADAMGPYLGRKRHTLRQERPYNDGSRLRKAGKRGRL